MKGEGSKAPRKKRSTRRFERENPVKKWQDNAGLEALILLFLKSQKSGSVFSVICSHVNATPRTDEDREVDRALQRLRKKGFIRYENRAWMLNLEQPK